MTVLRRKDVNVAVYHEDNVKIFQFNLKENVLRIVLKNFDKIISSKVINLFIYSGGNIECIFEIVYLCLVRIPRCLQNP